jgi:hypothetical protein
MQNIDPNVLINAVVAILTFGATAFTFNMRARRKRQIAAADLAVEQAKLTDDPNDDLVAKYRRALLDGDGEEFDEALQGVPAHVVAVLKMLIGKK